MESEKEKMHKEQLVSVVIPTYARTDTLSRALNSILNQTYKNLEIIVVDDNPPESPYRAMTAQRIAQYQDERIRYIQNKENLGGAGSRNAGIQEARGNYIAFLDDDDEYYPEKIEKQMAVFQESKNNRLALVYCDVEHIGKNGTTDCIVRKRHKGNCLYEAIVDDCLASTSMWLVNKELLNSVGNFSLVPCKQDSTVILKLLEQGYEVDYVPEVLCRYHNYGGSTRISFGPRKIEGEKLFFDACKKVYHKFSKKQIKMVEFSFAKRFYVLYGYRRDYNEEERIKYKKLMWETRPLATAAFLGKAALRNWKKRILK